MTAKDVQRFGPYVILDRIGDGGMAEIFLAKMQGYSGFEKLIALKKILPRYSQNRTFAQMLIHEAKLAAALQHFNVVQVLDLGEIDRQVFIAMEYVRGRDLAAVLSNTYRRKEKLPLALSLCIATEFMTGLDYAHRVRNAEGQPLGIIHRDISPQNVLISYEGEVKVTDFGIARVAEKEGFQLPGNLHGKFGYMSPEQVLGQDIDQRSDIFSAGVVLYEMLTGQRLFRGKEHKETIKMIISHAIPPPSTINPEVPPSVDRICAKALARDRNSRYQTMGGLLGELSRVSDTLPRRAATRDLAVYMRRQFGNSAGGFAVRGRPDPSQYNIGGFGVKSGEQDPGAAAASGERIPLGEILITQGAIGASDLELVLAEQRARGGRIGELLIASGTISEEDLLRALQSQSGLPSISQEDLTTIPPPASLLKRFPREAAEATMMLPISVNEEERSVRLAVSDPYDDRAILETKVVLGVNDVVVFLARRSAIRAAITRWYGEEHDSEASSEPVFAAVEAEAPSRPVVLFADADQALIASLVERVKEEDCDVVTALDGKTARQLCRERAPTVAFLDAALPGIDGYNILLELRSKSADAAVFITSSRGDEMRQAKALELGADDFIVKPFSLELTTSKIRREIQKRSGGRKVMAPAVNFAGVSGSLKDMTALDIMQGLELGKKTAQLVLQYNDGRSGELAVRNGDLKGCVAGQLLGEEAFYLLARPADGLFRIEYREPATPGNITKPNTFLMIEAMRRLDESGMSREGDQSSSGAVPLINGPMAVLEAQMSELVSGFHTPGPPAPRSSMPPPPPPPASLARGTGVPPAREPSLPPFAATAGVHPSFIESSPLDEDLPAPRNLRHFDRSPSPPLVPALASARPVPLGPPAPPPVQPPPAMSGAPVLPGLPPLPVMPAIASARPAPASQTAIPGAPMMPVIASARPAPASQAAAPAPMVPVIASARAKPISSTPPSEMKTPVTSPGSQLPPWSTIAPQPGAPRPPVPPAEPAERAQPSVPRPAFARRGGTVDMLRQQLEAARMKQRADQPSLGGLADDLMLGLSGPPPRSPTLPEVPEGADEAHTQPLPGPPARPHRSSRPAGQSSSDLPQERVGGAVADPASDRPHRRRGDGDDER